MKARTKADYFAMLEPGKTSKMGKKFSDGELYPIAEKPLSRIASIAEELISGGALKRMLNHAAG